MKTEQEDASRFPAAAAGARGRGLMLGLCAALLAPAAHAVEIDPTLKAEGVFEADGGRDAGLAGAKDHKVFYLDATPWVHFQFSPAWSAFVRARVFAPTGSVQPPSNDNNNIGPTSTPYIGLKEAWIDYRGLTSYPGESLRLGRQRVREESAEWWDQDIDSLRWIFDTTLLRAELAAAREFSSYRSDGAPLSQQQKDRTYILGSIGSDLSPNNSIGLRIARADDDGHGLPSARKHEREHVTWVGIYDENHFYDWQDLPTFAHWVAGNVILGRRRRAITDPVSGAVTGANDDKVHAWAAEAGGRFKLPSSPFQFGGAYVYSSGGHGSDDSRQYEQTGIQSNYSRFTGTRALINRYTDSYRAELGNLSVITGFASINAGDYDASAIFSRYERPHRAGRIVIDGLSTSPVRPDHVLGNGYDLVVTRYFGLRETALTNLEPGEDYTTSIRLRGSLFDPGAAYGPSAKLEYRVSLEGTLWY